jgi:YidC/Oxa1 family membrane protein insertase
MDKNQVTGLILISLLLLGYFYFAQDLQPPPTDTPETRAIEQQTTPDRQPQSTIRPAENQVQDSVKLAQQKQQYGDLANFMTGEAQEVVLENEELKIIFSSKGGVVSSVHLKQHQTFDKKPLILFDETSSERSFLVNLGDQEVDLTTLYFQDHQISNQGDTTELRFSIDLGEGNEIHQYYRLGQGHEMRYQIDLTKLGSTDPTAVARFGWKDRLKRQERSLEQSRRNSSVNYYLTDGSFTDLGDSSNDLEQEIVNQPIQWITLKQKFFTSGLISNTPFLGAMAATQVLSEEDTTVVKDLEMIVNLSQKSLVDEGFTYFFGPNNYQLMKKVADGFTKNVYLGWVLFAWINKWLIIPIFNFLETYVASYGIIIIILAFFIKIILSPISYKSYLSMAKMKVLKPQLDEIKEKFGDDMQKAQSAQMELYGKVGVNPLSGCIPMLLQMPILLAMFNFFPNSIELRQAGFLWADDLSSYDSILNLPFSIPFYGDHVSLFTLLMAGSTLLYTWSNQQMNASMQGPMKSMQYLMPVMMIFFFNNFSSGLTFYYFILNILNFGQQAIIKKYFIDEEKILKIMEENKARNKNKKKSKFQQRLEEAMKTAEETKKNKK